MCQCSHNGGGRGPNPMVLLGAIAVIAAVLTLSTQPADGKGPTLADVLGGRLPRLQFPDLSPGGRSIVPGKRNPPSGRVARGDIPVNYLRLYRQACGGFWHYCAGVGKVESDHGRSRAPGVRSGVNRFGCCAGPMQFNVRNGPPSTWGTYGRGGNPYDPRDAIPAAARLLRANGAPGNMSRALLAYNHSSAYVASVSSWARRYGGAR